MDVCRDWDSCLRDLAGPSSGPMPSNQHMHMPQRLPPAAARRYPAPPAPSEIPSAAVPPAAASRRELRSRPPLAPPSLPSPAMSGQRTLQDELNQRMHARAAAHASRAARWVCQLLTASHVYACTGLPEWHSMCVSQVDVVLLFLQAC